MRAAVALTLLLAACSHGKPSAPVSGPPATEPPQVLAQGVVRHDFTPSPPTTVPTTTTTQPVTTMTAAPVVPMTAAPPAAYGSRSVWDDLADCESGARDKHGNPIPGTANWHINTGNGYYGGLQFSLGSWEAVGGTGYPHEHSREEQIEMGKRLQATPGGWGHWPDCSRRLGLR